MLAVVRIVNTDPGWILFLENGVSYTKFSILAAPESSFFCGQISACLSLPVLLVGCERSRGQSMVPGVGTRACGKA